MKRLYCWFFLVVMLMGACTKETNFKTFPSGPVKHHLIVLAKTRQGVKARGFLGSTPAKTEIFCEVGKKSGRVTSNDDGSFVIDLADADQTVPTGELTFSIENKYYQQGYQIRDLTESLRAISKEVFTTDKEVDALSFFDNKVAIVSSQANLLRTFSIDEFFRLSDSPDSAVLLATATNEPLFPNALAANRAYTVVNLNLTHETALVDNTRNKVVMRTKLKDDQGEPFRFPLPIPLTVKNPLDADDTGTEKTTLTSSMARNPECIMALDDTHFLVAYGNYYQFEDQSQAQNSVVGPGVIAIMVIENGALKSTARAVLDFKNPHYFLKADNNTVWVIAWGSWSNIGKSNITSSDAGLVRLKISADHTRFTIEHRLPLPDFTPALPAVVNGKLIIPHFEKNEIAVVDENATAINSSDIKRPSFHRDFRFTFAAHWHDDVVFLGDKLGTIVAYSLAESYFPFPFIEPIVIDKHVDERIGLRPSLIYFRHKEMQFDIKTTYPQGYDAWLHSDSHQKIYPLYFPEVFGP